MCPTCNVAMVAVETPTVAPTAMEGEAAAAPTEEAK